MMQAIAYCPVFIKQLKELRATGRRMIPQALVEMDNRLAALLAGDLRAATQSSHTIATGLPAPSVARLESHTAHAHGATTLRNGAPPEPHNTRRLRERHIVALAGKREYARVDANGRPVGARAYEHGVTEVDNPPLSESYWRESARQRVKQGWPNLAKEYKPETFAMDYANFAGHLRSASTPAGSPGAFKRIVAHNKPDMDTGPYYNRELPVDGHDLRAGSAVKEPWNSDGEYVELQVPPAGHPVWKELHALQEKAAGIPVRYAEELNTGRGPPRRRSIRSSSKTERRSGTSGICPAASRSNSSIASS